MARRHAVACENLQLALIAQNIVHPATEEQTIRAESADDRIDPIVERDLIVGTRTQIDRLDQTHCAVIEERGFAIVTQHGVLPATGGDQISACPTDHCIGSGGKGNRIRCSLGVVGNAGY